MKCGQIALDADADAHLSCMPAMTEFSFTPSITLLDQITPSDPPLLPSTSHKLTLKSESLEPIAQLLSQIRLPALTDLAVFIRMCPSKLETSYFFTSVQNSATCYAIQGLQLCQRTPSDGEFKVTLNWETSSHAWRSTISVCCASISDGTWTRRATHC